jgi:hypothetical protein
MQKFERKKNIFERFLSKIPWPKPLLTHTPNQGFAIGSNMDTFIVRVL